MPPASGHADPQVAANPLLYKPILETPAGEKAVAKGDKVRKTEHPDHRAWLLLLACVIVCARAHALTVVVIKFMESYVARRRLRMS